MHRWHFAGLSLALLPLLAGCGAMYKYDCKGDGSFSTGVNSNEREVDEKIREATAKGMTCVKEAPGGEKEEIGPSPDAGEPSQS